MSSNTIAKILLVDDEPDILEFMKYNLVKEGYEVIMSDNGSDALALARNESPDLILLDVMMPGMDGVEVCENLRANKETENILVAFLTARTEDYSQVAGFDAGADDYISKPIRPKVLMSRISALLRRQGKKREQENLIEVSDLIIDRERYTVTKGESENIDLPRKEFELLSLLASRPGKVFSRDEILSIVWGNEVVVGGRTIDVHIRKLREKMGEGYIKTIKGVGYKFEG
jgi:two-component system alkaline phosphatase synthesis response regulator PhoP